MWGERGCVLIKREGKATSFCSRSQGRPCSSGVEGKVMSLVEGRERPCSCRIGGKGSCRRRFSPHVLGGKEKAVVLQGPREGASPHELESKRVRAAKASFILLGKSSGDVITLRRSEILLHLCSNTSYTLFLPFFSPSLY